MAAWDGMWLHLHVLCVRLGGRYGYGGKWGRRVALRELLCLPDSDSHGGSCCMLSLSCRSDDRVIFGWRVTEDRFEIITSNMGKRNNGWA
jgi:hypothetical protein